MAIAGWGGPVSHETILGMVGRVLIGKLAAWATFKMAAVSGSNIGAPLGRVARLNWSTASPQAGTHSTAVDV